jgi:hypothetical protein
MTISFLAKSPFVRMQWFNREYASRDFLESWDMGRAILVSAIGMFDSIREKLIHRLLLLLHLIPLHLEISNENP